MFTGLIETTGTVVSLQKNAGAPRLTIAAPQPIIAKLTEGASIAINGVCLTALAITDEHFSADLAAETLARTTLASFVAGTTVNLELPTPAGSPMGGHIVQGHVDGVAELLSLDPVTPENIAVSDWILRLAVPSALAASIVPQGSITVDGISLTVAGLRELPAAMEVRVAVIPHTYAVTHLHTLTAGAKVNIETDVLAKYAQREPARATVSLEYLISNGY